MSIVDTAQFKRGREAEEYIEACLIRDGFHILSTRDFKTAMDRAPRLHGYCSHPICPDTMAFRDGRSYWIEAKAKSAPMLFQMLDREEHGIDTHCAEHYLKVQRISGVPVWILVYEETRNDAPSGVVLIGSLLSLIRNMRISPPSSGWRMWNFLRSDFTEIDPSVIGSFAEAIAQGAT